MGTPALTKLFLEDLVDINNLESFNGLRIVAPNKRRTEIIGVEIGSDLPDLMLKDMVTNETGWCKHEQIPLLLKCEVIQNENY